MGIKGLPRKGSFSVENSVETITKPDLFGRWSLEYGGLRVVWSRRKPTFHCGNASRRRKTWIEGGVERGSDFYRSLKMQHRGGVLKSIVERCEEIECKKI